MNQAIDKAPESRPPFATNRGGDIVTWTIPLQVSISLGAPQVGTAAPVSPMVEGPEAVRLGVPIIFDDLPSRQGYRPDFLGTGDAVSLPALTAAGRAAVATLDDGSWELKYHKFSIVMHKGRRLALFTAANVDWRADHRLVNGRKPTRRELTGLAEGTAEQWVTDPRIAALHQLPDVFFTRDGGAFDKGHLVRRDDMCWGISFEDIQKANGDTFHTTNCSPQVADFNRPSSDESDNWGDLEQLVQSATQAEKTTLFSGPVLAADDPEFDGRDGRGRIRVRIPRAFWKIIVIQGRNGLEAYGFVLEQDLAAVPRPTEFSVPDRWRRHLRSLDAIEEKLGGLVDLDALKSIDRYDTTEGRRVAEAMALST